MISGTFFIEHYVLNNPAYRQAGLATQAALIGLRGLFPYNFLLEFGYKNL
jgi:hypothetical protein